MGDHAMSVTPPPAVGTMGDDAMSVAPPEQAAGTKGDHAMSVAPPPQFVVLDLDQTLIDVNESQADLGRPAAAINRGNLIFTRPGVAVFLRYCFERFQGVGLWTRATSAWADTALRAPELSEFRERFAFVWTIDGDLVSGPKVSVGLRSFSYGKPLRLIWQDRAFRELGWSAQSTLLIDDSPDNFASPGNDVLVRAYGCEENVDDVDGDDLAGEPHLVRLMAVLEQFRHAPDVRAHVCRLDVPWWLPDARMPSSGSDNELV